MTPFTLNDGLSNSVCLEIAHASYQQTAGETCKDKPLPSVRGGNRSGRVWGFDVCLERNRFCMSLGKRESLSFGKEVFQPHWGERISY